MARLRDDMKPTDVYELTAVSDPRVSPDGKTCAFVLTTVDKDENTYLSAIWVVPVDGSSKPRRFTFGKKRDAMPRWSPDGTSLAFVSNRDDEKAAQLYVIPAEGGEARKLTDCRESVEEIAWSGNGARIAFTTRVRDQAYEEDDDRKRRPRHITRLANRLDSVGWTIDRPKHIFVTDLDGRVKQLTRGDQSDSSPAWSPDSKQIAFVSARHRDWDIDVVNDIYVVDARGGRPRKLTKTEDSCGSPSWSPDGKRIAYNVRPGRWGTRHTQIAVLDVATKETSLVTESLDRNCAPFMATREPVWKDGRLVFALEDAGNNAIYEGLDPVVAGELRLHGYDGDVYAASTPKSLPELYNRGGKKLTSFAKIRNVLAPKRFTAKSADGKEVEAWIIPPAGFAKGKRYPVLVNIHGGPFTQYGSAFFDEFQVYAEAGYAVVYCNPRGSSGYSEAWGAAINGPKLGGRGWGTVDYEDVMAVTETALRRFDFCDPDRVGVMGGSYGGYMTSWIVSHTDFFKAAISERAVNAWHSMHGSSDFGWPFSRQFGTMLWEDPDGWAEMSPITYATNIRTPLLIMHSENDLRCPIEQAGQLFTILRLLKRDVEFVRFPAESHELSRSGSPAHRVQRFEIILDWFGRKL